MFLLNFDLTKIGSLALKLLPKKIPVVLVLDTPPVEDQEGPQPLGYRHSIAQALKEVLEDTGLAVKRTGGILPFISLDLDREKVLSLGQLNEIKEIWYDFKVFQTLEDSNQIDNIHQVRETFNVTGKGNTAYVLDTAMDLDHPNLKNAIVGHKDLIRDEDYINPEETHHASHVAGIIASDHPTYTGIAPDTKIYSVKILRNDGSGEMSIIMEGLDFVLQERGKLINLSVGGLNPLCLGSCPVCQSINTLALEKIISIIAAGNSGFLPYTLCCPGKAGKGITAGAVDNNKNIPYWSSRSGPGSVNKPDFTGMGVDIVSCSGNGEFMSMSGTSMTTPRHTGYTSLVIERLLSMGVLIENITPDLIRCIFKNASTGGLIYNSGSGFIDISKALELLNTVDDLEHYIC